MHETFHLLVRNALHFLQRSATEMKAQALPTALTNFCGGLELLLKAGVLWELGHFAASDLSAVALPYGPDRLSTANGQTGFRLDVLLDCPLTAKEGEVYQRLFNACSGAAQADADTLLIGWIQLHQRLTGPWKQRLADFSEPMDLLFREVSGRSDFYPAILAALSDANPTPANANRQLCRCRGCLQPGALAREALWPNIHKVDCLVCGKVDAVVFLPCQNKECRAPAPRQFGLVNLCPSCGHPNPASFAESRSSFASAETVAWCGDCGYFVQESVVLQGRATLCLACHSFHGQEDVNLCGWCGSQVTGAVGDYEYPGCVRCVYHIAYQEQNEPAPEYLNPPDEFWHPVQSKWDAVPWQDDPSYEDIPY